MNNFQKLVFLLFFLEIKLIIPQIYDNYESGILEEGNYDILDVIDYHNINLIVSTSKNIYKGIPPKKTVKTNANLINSTSLITINENFLLAACLQDSFLGKISLSDGKFTSFLSYTDISISSSLQIPIKSCSLSNIDNTIFIGYSKIEYFEDTNETNKTNIIFKIEITNKDSITDGPLIDISKEIKYFQFPVSTIMTSSSRQISCEPLRIKNNENNEYRLVCLHEGIYQYSSEGESIWENKVYATTIRSDFSNFEINMTEIQINYGNNDLGFRIFKENDTYSRCMTSNSLVEIYLTTTDSITKISKTYLPNILYKFDADMDLFSYNNKFRFSAKKTAFMGIDNIFYFQINFNYYPNYFMLYNYQEKNIKKLLGYYNQEGNKIFCLYQTSNNLKYFVFDYKRQIFTFDYYSSDYNSYRYIKSYETIEYDINFFSDLGYLNVESIKYGLYGWVVTETKYFGIDFLKTLASNNKLIPEPSLNDWKTYYFSLMEHNEKEYTRIYHLNNLNLVIETCKEDCFSCWDGYNTCTDCSQRNDMVLLKGSEDECYPSSYIIKQYIFNEEANQFVKCYQSCEYCLESNITSADNKHNCASCLSGYLYSYVYLGNCYKYDNLRITEEKQVIEGKFISAKCSKYKISSTGECI